MNKEKETVELREGKCVIGIGGYSIDDVHDLEDALLMAAMDYAVNNWKFRDAPSSRKAKDSDPAHLIHRTKTGKVVYPNNGKTFSFAQIVADMAAANTRSGAPNEADVKGADAWFNTMLATAEADESIEDKLEYAWHRLSTKVEVNNDKFAGLSFQLTDDDMESAETMKAAARRLWRRVRLWKPNVA